MKKIQKKYRDLLAEDLVRIICQVADQQKALDIVALDVRGVSGFADYFVIMGGTSTRHVQGLAGVIDREIASKRSKPADTEGLNEGEWILLDYNDVIVHIFYHEIRAHYDLEGLWHDAPRLDLTIPIPVIAEPVVKKTKKKPTVRPVKKAAEKAVGKPAKRQTRQPAEPPTKAVKAVRKPPKGLAKQSVKKTGARTTSKPTGRMSGKAASKPMGKSASKPISKGPGKSTTKSTGKPPGKPFKKATAPRSRNTGSAKK